MINPPHVINGIKKESVRVKQGIRLFFYCCRLSITRECYCKLCRVLGNNNITSIQLKTGRRCCLRTVTKFNRVAKITSQRRFVEGSRWLWGREGDKRPTQAILPNIKCYRGNGCWIFRFLRMFLLYYYYSRFFFS